MPAAIGVVPADRVITSHWPREASAIAALRSRAASSGCRFSELPRRPFQPLSSSARKMSNARAASSAVLATVKRTSPCSPRRRSRRRRFFSFFVSRSWRSRASPSRLASRPARVQPLIRRGLSPSVASTRVNAAIASPSRATSRSTRARAPAARACAIILAAASSAASRSSSGVSSERNGSADTSAGIGRRNARQHEITGRTPISRPAESCAVSARGTASSPFAAITHSGR